MDAFEAQTAYHSIRARFDAGQIPVDDYNLKVRELRYQDNTGIWWTISPADGSWLRWNGTSWEPAFTHREPVSGLIKPAQHGVHESQPSWYIPPSGKIHLRRNLNPYKCCGNPNHLFYVVTPGTAPVNNSFN